MMTRTIARTRLATPDVDGWAKSYGDCPDEGDTISGWRVVDVGAHHGSGAMSGWWVRVVPA